MIQIETISIENINDFDVLSTKINPEYFHTKILDELKTRIGLKINKIIIEYPYYDVDYLSTYYLYYSKKHHYYSKKGYRIHFLKDTTYFGYITLRPTVSYTKTGKSYLHPFLLLQNSAYLLNSTFKANILGREVEVDGYPWMYQETGISVCAHVAIWTMSRYYGNKYKKYNCYTMGEITEKTNEYLGRKVPCDGLNLIQISNIISQLGFSPLIVKKMSGKEPEFFEEIYSYIESGIPCLGVMTRKQHAVSLIGHGNIKKSINLSGKVLSYELVESLIAIDDNYFPYIEVYKNSIINPITKYSLDDFDFIVVPLYDRMQYGYREVRNNVYNLIDSKSFDFPDDIVIRIYLTSANSLKRETLNNESMNLILKEYILNMEMPKFIWCVDISTYIEYENGKISGRIFIDSTCNSHEPSPWLLIHDSKKFVFLDDKTWYNNNTTINPYNIYRNNLRRFEV